MNALRSLCAIYLLVLSGCHKSNDEATAPTPAPEIATEDVALRYETAVARLNAFTEGGQVVSRNAAGGAEHVGDSLIWTWTAIGELGCDEGRPMLDQALARLTGSHGYQVRYEPLPAEYQGGNEISVDGELGYYFGMAGRARHCPEDIPALAAAWELRDGAIDASGGRLHPNAKAFVNGTPLTAVHDQVANILGMRGEPSNDRVYTLGSALATWTRIVTTTKSACFRVNLAWLSLRAMELAGRPTSSGTRDAICQSTAGVGLPLVDQWCGRDGLKDYLAGFANDQWEYRHQRCGAWESPDGGGLVTPGLDEIVGLRELYGSSL